MDLTPYVDGLHRELLASAGANDGDAMALAERLTASVTSATRLTMLDVLSAAADEITRDLVPGSVEVRLRGRNPYFVVTPATLHEPLDNDFAPPQDGPAPHVAPAPEEAPPSGTEGAVGRINFRPPEQLKARIEAAAAKEGLSLNAYLVRITTAALDADATPSRSGRRGSGPTRHYVGWVG
ncbi:type II toxin-antitoxin system HicB family antitoxin [Streptomyces sp. NBC_01210]|uniref:toxin-antitoxin system HicB family antitoxin n=1 Tax=Streptomyces sp. NBC_01210 TaxID=2903774 RepID=UPI002E15DE59|nr:type II toxin-antitoxin system HicB family antitoxin [Streptomyces sp. NBC_01210]